MGLRAALKRRKYAFFYMNLVTFYFSLVEIFSFLRRMLHCIPILNAVRAYGLEPHRIIPFYAAVVSLVFDFYSQIRITASRLKKTFARTISTQFNSPSPGYSSTATKCMFSYQEFEKADSTMKHFTMSLFKQ